ncbi:hypothetical protein DY000_02009812 [Brassica cretica]|uniref:Uncharacterized protein n=1 Tax=Brassica cretica TaxID=69181 RepID=A0ABQ7C8M0_BRACR|nr:hypothetical protein DY000_02009812 [Brassica cretica]
MNFKFLTGEGMFWHLVNVECNEIRKMSPSLSVIGKPVVDNHQEEDDDEADDGDDADNAEESDEEE